jgi:hypothetical protein
MSICFVCPYYAWAADSPEDGWQEHLPFDISGRYSADYIGRWNSEDSEDDHQLFQYLRVKLDNIYTEKISLRFSGRLSTELDGRDDDDDFFADIYDAFNHDANGRIYSLYLEIEEPVFSHSRLRVGRQYSYEPKSLLFTGAKYEQTIREFRFYMQGGWRASHYTSPEDDDTVGGFGVDYRVLPRTHVGYDYLRVVDGPLDDDYHSVDVFQRFGSLKAYARFSVLNTEADELNLYSSYYHAPLDVSLTARYYALLSERERLTNEFSALYDVDFFDTDDEDTLGVYFPFHLVNISAYKGFADDYAVSGGFETRWMDDESERNDLNREYDRYFLSLSAFDALIEDLTLTLTCEYWDANAGEDSIAVGLDVDREINERLDVGGGFYFSRYRIRSEFAGMSFSEDIETPEIYGKLKYKLRENVHLLVRYQIEDEDDLGTTQEIRLGCSITF